MDDFGRALRLAFYFVVGIGLGGGSVAAFAQHQAGTPFSVIGADGKFIGSYYSDAPTFRVPSSWGAQAAGGGMSANGSGGVTLYNKAKLSGGGVSALVNLAKNVNASGLAVVARVAAKMLGPVAVAGLAYDAYMTWDAEQQVWMKPTSEGPPTETLYRLYPGYTQYDYTETSTPVDTCRTFAASQTGGTRAWKVEGLQCHVDFQTYYDTYHTYRSVYTIAEAPKCADGSDPVSGVCLSGAPSPASDQDIDTAITQALQANPSAAPQVAQQAIQATGQVPAADPIVSSGPASIQGPTTTSTSSGPAGISTTTTNNTYNISYGGPTVTVTENRSVTYTAPDGTQTTTNDTTTPPPDGELAPEPPKPLCEEFPDASGCAKLGIGADPGPVAEQAAQVNQITPESIGGSGGACPADRVMNTSYGTLTFSWSNLCGLAEGVRPVILAMAWLVAGFSFFFGAKRSGV